MALRLGLGLIIGRDVSSTLVPSTSTSTNTLPTSTITRTRLLFNDDQQTGTLHLKEYSRKWVSNAENFSSRVHHVTHVISADHYASKNQWGHMAVRQLWVVIYWSTSNTSTSTNTLTTSTSTSTMYKSLMTVTF